MKVLIACEESQRVCIAFREKGHEAYSCDILEPSGGHPEWHIHGDVLRVIGGGTVTTMDGKTHDIGKWDMMIAHPPCTYLSAAGACRMYPRKGEIDAARLEKAMAAKAFFMTLLNADIPRIAVENPKPLSVVKLPQKSQTIQPYEYGEPYSKRTLLWLKGLPPLKPTNIVNPICSYVSGGSKRADGSLRLNKGTKIRSSIERSKTFIGIAQAMAEQWG